MRSKFQIFNQALQSIGIGGRILKTTFAVMLAWILGTQLPGGFSHPYFAPLAALLSFQVTIADSISSAMQRIFGIVAGVTLALVVTHLLGVSVWTVGLMVLLALTLGARLHLTPQGTSQVAVSAMIVLFIGNADSVYYAGMRVLESIIGAVVGVTVNALIAPPNYVPAAQASIRSLADAIAERLEKLAEAVDQGWSHFDQAALLENVRALRSPLSTAQTALAKAKTGLKYNLLHRTQQLQIEQLDQILNMLDHSVTQSRTIARVLFDSVTKYHVDDLDWREPHALSTHYAEMLRALAMQVRALAEQQPEADLQAREQFITSRNQLELATQSIPGISPATWMHLGAVIASAERMSNDLLGDIPNEPEIEKEISELPVSD
jgi:uncharacterized membrane protein YgaE (UPF0421/DUF939 family)